MSSSESMATCDPALQHLTVHILDPSGSTRCTLDAPPNEDIAKLRTQLEGGLQKGLRAVLVFDGSILENGRSLLQCGLTMGAVLTLVIVVDEELAAHAAMLAEHLQDEPGLRRLGIQGLGSLGGAGLPHVRTIAEALAGDSDEGVRWRAVYALAKLGGTACTTEIRLALAGDTADRVRIAAADALGRLCTLTPMSTSTQMSFRGSTVTGGEGYPVVESFDDLDLSESLLRGIYSYGIEKPSAIQQRAIEPVLKGRDVIGQGQPGTGKTVTFIVGALNLIHYESCACQALILAPTRELANQIQNVALALGGHLKVGCHACTGGTSVRDDIDKLRDGQHMVVGTPGCMLEMISKRYLRVDNLKIFVLDEADEMLSRGFKDQIYDIFKCLPPNIQVCLFSVTMAPEILDLTGKFMHDAVRILVKKDELTLYHVNQFYVAHEEDEELKIDMLYDLHDAGFISHAIIYCNTLRQVYNVAAEMSKRHVNVSTMHAELDQKERDLIMREFLSDSSQMLISTDMLARGLQDVFFKVNYNLPQNLDNYLQRIGRSPGRWGQRGVAINFVTNTDLRKMKDIEKYYHTRIEEMPTDPEELVNFPPMDHDMY